MPPHRIAWETNNLIHVIAMVSWLHHKNRSYTLLHANEYIFMFRLHEDDELPEKVRPSFIEKGYING